MTGDQPDFVTRLRNLFPSSWFPTPLTVRSLTLFGFITGAANQFAAIYSMLVYAKAQQRMQTTSDAFLEIAAVDYTDMRIQRRVGEGDTSFRERIVEEVLRLRNTRQAIFVALTELTGRPPQIFLPANTADGGALDVGTLACDVAGCVGTGFDEATSIPFAYFVNAYRPLSGSGITIADSEIYAMVNDVTAAGITAWVNIQN